jgi:hypothetical protein
MKPLGFARHILAVTGMLALAGLPLAATPAHAGIDVRIDIGNAPPAPQLVFRAHPHEQFDADDHVWVVDDPAVGDNDCFRYGGYYWMFRDGYWYRAAHWRRRFVVVQPRYVPEVFYRMPERHWKHRPSGPPGLAMRRGGMPPGQARRDGDLPPGQAKKQERGRGHDKGHGRDDDPGDHDRH